MPSVRFSNPVYLRAFVGEQNKLPEQPVVVFAGRSNVGKSSVINALCGGRFARVSRTPGRTRAVQLFSLDDNAVLADLPGYGYAAAPKQEKKAWQELMLRFLSEAPIFCLVVVVDCRRGIGELDEMLLSFFNPTDTRILIILNKADKLNKHQQRQVREATQAQTAATVLLFSALKKTGVEEVQRYVGNCFDGDGRENHRQL